MGNSLTSPVAVAEAENKAVAKAENNTVAEVEKNEECIGIDVW